MVGQDFFFTSIMKLIRYCFFPIANREENLNVCGIVMVEIEIVAQTSSEVAHILENRVPPARGFLQGKCYIYFSCPSSIFYLLKLPLDLWSPYVDTYGDHRSNGDFEK
jgi:hypothetical protein